METKPTRVKVGQRWLSMNVEGVVDSPYQNALGTWWMRFPSGRFPWTTEGILSLTYLGLAETPPVPAVGQRYWQRGENPGWFDVIEVPWAKNNEMFLVRWDDDGEGAIQFTELAHYRLDTQEPKATKKSAAPSTPVMGERDGEPVRCLACGAAKQVFMWCCEACSLNGVSVALYDEWRAGARDFPRREAKPASDCVCPCPPCFCKHETSPSVPSVSKPAATDSRCVRCNGVHAEIACPPGWTSKSSAGGRAPLVGDAAPGCTSRLAERPKSQAPIKREVSHNGRDWTAFQIIQQRELDRENTRAETARVLATFVDDFDLLPDAGT